MNLERNLVLENYYKWIRFSKENSYYSMKLLKNKGLLLLADPHNAKEHYQSFLRKKYTKSVKQSKIITQQPKTFENWNIVDIKSVIIEYPKLRINYPRL